MSENAGLRRRDLSGSSGVIERVQQDGKMRLVMMRLEAPAPGVAMIGTYRLGGRINISMCVYFYGDDAEGVATASADKWQAWLGAAFAAGT